MSRILGKIMLALVGFAVLGYFGFHMWRAVYSDYQTQPAESFLVSEVVSTRGIAVREELVLEESGEELSYLYTDGEHVSKNAPVARRVDDPSEITDQMRRDILQKELDNLLALEAAGDTVMLGTDTVTQRIYTDIDTAAAATAAGMLSGAPELRLNILGQLNRREMATNKETSFTAQTEKLQSEMMTIGASSFSDENAILAPNPGYFTKTVDSLESVLTPEYLETATAESLTKLMDEPVELQEDSAGKLITSYHWFFAAVMDAVSLPKFQEGKRVELDFGIAGQRPVLASIKSVSPPDKEGGSGVVVFECDEMNEALSNMREHKVEISVDEVSGYKLPRSSKHYLNDVQGVYVLETTIIRFKPTEIIYEDEEQDYVIYRENFGERDGLRRFDNVIVAGRGLYDGKIIKQ